MPAPGDHRRRHDWELAGLGFSGVSPGFWSVVIARQLQRLQEAQDEFVAGAEAEHADTSVGFVRGAYERHRHESRIVAESYFLLMAIDHLHRTAPLYGRRTSDRRIKAAVRTFEKDHRQAADLRNVVEHVEEYFFGGGEQRERFEAGPKEVPGFSLTGAGVDDEVLVTFGTLSLELKAAGRGGCPNRRGTSPAIPVGDGQTVTGSVTS